MLELCVGLDVSRNKSRYTAVKWFSTPEFSSDPQ